jgi:PEGA domain-containing protein
VSELGIHQVSVLVPTLPVRGYVWLAEYMMKSPETTEQLARAYREARVLVLGDPSPKIDRVTALHRDFLAIRAKFHQAGQKADDADWDLQLFEKTRRATIVALRHQALLIVDQAERVAAFEETAATRRATITHALQLANEAVDLHAEKDRDRDKTTAVVESIRRHLAGVQAIPVPPNPSDVSPSALEEGLAFRSPTPTPSQDATPTPVVVPQRANSEPKRSPWWRANGSLTAAKVSIGLAIAVVGGVAYLAFNSGRTAPVTTSDSRAESSGVVRVAPTPLATPQVPPAAVPPAAIRTTAVPRPTPSGIVTMLVQSNPTAARVTVGGEFRGATPLRLTGRPGEHRTLLLYKGRLTWRGNIRFSGQTEQAVTIVLTPVASTARPPVASTRLVEGSAFEVALRSGIELYHQGWYGPASARFKRAATLEPRSAEAHLWWGRALTKVYQYADARRALEKVVVLAESGPLADEAVTRLRKLQRRRGSR